MLDLEKRQHESRNYAIIECDHNNDNDENHSQPTSETKAKYEIVSKYVTLICFCSTNLVHLIILLALQRYRTRKERPTTLIQRLINGTIASAVSVWVTKPLWTAKASLQSKNDTDKKCLHYSKSNLLQEVALISRQNGIGALWNGCGASLIHTSLNSPLQILIFDALHRQLSKLDPTKHLSTATARKPSIATLTTIISMMIVSRCTSATITHPISVAERRRQSNHTSNDQTASNESLIGTMLDIIKVQGSFALYQGMKRKLSQTIILTSLLAFTHPRILNYIWKIYKTNAKRNS